MHTSVEHAPVFLRGGSVVPMLNAPASPPSSAAGLSLLVALSNGSESGSAAGSLFVDDGETPRDSEDVLLAHSADASTADGTLVATFSVAQRTLTSMPSATAAAAAAGVHAQAAKYAFPTVVDEVVVAGVFIGITELILATLNATTGIPLKTRVVPKTDYTWDGRTLSAKRLAQELAVPFSLQWTI